AWSFDRSARRSNRSSESHSTAYLRTADCERVFHDANTICGPGYQCVQAGIQHLSQDSVEKGTGTQEAQKAQEGILLVPFVLLVFPSLTQPSTSFITAPISSRAFSPSPTKVEPCIVAQARGFNEASSRT